VADSAIKRHRFVAAGLPPSASPIYIFGKPDELDLFFKDTFLELVDALDPAIRSVNVGARSRRQYPGDPTPVRQSSGVRRTAIAGDYRRVALPGRPFWCEIELTAPGVKPRKMLVRQFTLSGSFTQIRVLAPSWAADSFVLRSPGGRGWEITPGSGTP
jgi:hypothetical protein